MINDVASKVALLCLERGMMKLNYVLQSLSYPGAATFELSADFSITKNKDRFDAGFANGVYYCWGDGKRPIIFPDVKPNGCGMLVVELEFPVEDRELIERADTLSREGWEISTGNHFVITGVKNSGYFGIIHCGSGKKQTLYGYEAETHTTPWGPCSTITGDRAAEYYAMYKAIDIQSRQKRLEYANHLFDSFSVISNETHQGMLSMNEITLGCHKSDGITVYPMTISPKDKAYLVTAERGKIIPHGSGYELPDYSVLEDYVDINGRRFFTFKLANGTREIVEYPYNTAYRGTAVVDSAMAAGTITVVDELEIMTSLKF